MTVESRLRALADRWASAAPAERSDAQSYLIELAEAVDVERPRPAGAGYEFEFPVRVVTRDGTETVKFADLNKRDCFLLEAKDEVAGASTDILLRRAFGQAVEYAAFVPGGAPPYLMVLDVGATLIVWDRWHGTYGGFQPGQRIDLRTLASRPDDIALLQDICERPEARNPLARSAAVTREIARHLAELASRFLSTNQRGSPTASRVLIHWRSALLSTNRHSIIAAAVHGADPQLLVQPPGDWDAISRRRVADRGWRQWPRRPGRRCGRAGSAMVSASTMCALGPGEPGARPSDAGRLQGRRPDAAETARGL